MSDDERRVELYNQDPNLSEDFGDKEWPFSGKGALDDIPVPTGAACIKISDILGRAGEHSGDFSFGGQADQLPVVPGLFVDGVGPVPVPLWEERAHRIIEKCTKSPFGHNMDTKMDENVRKSWELQPDQVQIKNPLWQVGIEKMAVTIAERLGYTDIPLQCVLYKLLVYGEGGHFLKHQDTEKEDGMIATLVVQPPSLHEGGDLIVYRNGEVKHRHDFGKADGTATYLPHYAVHYADAEHALERVTKGYRLALVYSVCLPADMRHLERNPNRPMSGELAQAIKSMTTEEDHFALLLDHEYTKNSIKGFGPSGLKGVDRTRFLALDEANNSVSAEAKLQFYLVELHHDIEFCGNGGELGDWDEEHREEKATWYTTDGSRVGRGEEMDLKLNFLNPCHETQSQRWKKPFGSSDVRGYMGNEGPSKESMYCRYAVAAWPVANSAENVVKFVNIQTAAAILEELPSLDTAKLRKFMDTADAKLAILDAREKEWQADPWHRHKQFIPVHALWDLCEALSRLVGNADDSSLVNLFFSNFFKRTVPTWYLVSGKKLCVQRIAAMLEKFGWSDVAPGLLQALDGQSNKEVASALAIATQLTRRDLQQTLLTLAVEKAVKLDDETLSSFRSLESLWAVVFSHSNEMTLQTLAGKFQQMSPRFLIRTIKTFSNFLGDGRFPDEKKAMLVAILVCRSEWLASQIRVLERPFSWEMPAAEFPDFPQVETFLRSSEATITTEGMFSSEDEPRVTKKLCSMRGLIYPMDSSFKLEDLGRGWSGAVKIIKTREWYDQRQPELRYMQKELKDLRAAIAETLVNILRRRRLAS